MRLLLEDAKRQVTFLADVKAKLASGEYITRPTGGKRHSAVWDVFEVVVEAKTGLPVGANFCTQCKEPCRASGESGTTTMSRHIRYRCKAEGVLNRPIPNSDAKNHAKKAAARACAEGMLSFDSVTSDGVVDLMQTMVDIGARHGPVSAVELIPCANTLAAHLRAEANAIRAEEVPKIKAAMEEGACAATVDSWTESKTQHHYLSLTVHYIDDIWWNLQSEYLLTIGFDDDETGMSSKSARKKSLCIIELIAPVWI